jgi:hypothetical protein
MRQRRKVPAQLSESRCRIAVRPLKELQPGLLLGFFAFGIPESPFCVMALANEENFPPQGA